MKEARDWNKCLKGPYRLCMIVNFYIDLAANIVLIGVFCRKTNLTGARLS